MSESPLQHWSWAQSVVRFTTVLPPSELVQGTRAVACHRDGRVAVCVDGDGRALLPGGTRERDEPAEECLLRELAEEAGVLAASRPHWFAAHVGLSYHRVPYRDYAPFPLKAWLWGFVLIDEVGQPRGSADSSPEAETVSAVKFLPFDDALEAVRDSPRGCADALSQARGLADAHCRY
ncbi:NUDIX hydrolase [Actinoplanes sp. G11-F43]|uniref:NUDIX hydrolase n=1 Tax=Actinoplanes sp. G11-F43 TaxID=3424130 RepID=UPI003D336A5A